MRPLIATAIALTAALIATGPAIDLKAAPNTRPRDIKVSVSFQDSVGDKIQSDGGGAYKDAVGGVVGYIAASNGGSLIFTTNTRNTAGRSLKFFFDTCLLAPDDCDASWGSVDEKAGLLANILRGGSPVPGGLMAMTTVEGELAAWIKFDIPRDSDPAFYNVCFDSRKAVGPCGAAAGGTSTDARIRRVASDEWTISANGIGDRGDLIRDSQSGRNSRTFTVLGTYSMPFSFTVKCVNPADCS